MPTLGEILADQLELSETAAAVDESLDQGYRKTMW